MTDDFNYIVISYGKYFPEGSMMMIKKKLQNEPEDAKMKLFSMEFKDPTIVLIVSLLGGSLGLDRFYIGDIGLGVAKLLTCGGCGIWAIIDLFLIMDATKKKNLDKFAAFI